MFNRLKKKEKNKNKNKRKTRERREKNTKTKQVTHPSLSDHLQKTVPIKG